MSRSQFKRRSFLKAAGACIALPLFESVPRVTAAGETVAAGETNSGAELNSAADPTARRRLVCVGNEFGMYPGAFWPATEGRDYEQTPLLKPLAGQRDRLTLFGHLDHGHKGGHFAVHSFLTGVKSPDAKAMEEGGISLDQKAAEFVGARTRFPSLTLGSENGLHGGCMMSWTRTGTRVPPMTGPRELFRTLFVDEASDAKRRTSDRLALQGSILDAVLGDAQSLQKQLSQRDSRKLDEYFASIRDVEVKLDLARHWQTVPKPSAPIGEPENKGLANDLPAMYDLIALALETDSTRVATLEIGGSFAASDLGIRKGYHSLSHHGQLPENLELLVQIEQYQMEQFARFLAKLDALRDPDSNATLLDQTMVLLGSGMGNANSHTNHDLPIILAGGGFRHGEFRKFPEESRRRVPLCNLYVSLLQRFGVETDAFSMSTGTLNGLELA